MKRHLNRGMTLVEMLIAMAILAVVLVITSSGIIQSLQVNRLAEDAANTQSKLRRISEVVSQELRSAVMGGLTDYPVQSGESSVSFALMSGDGGLPVTGNYLNRTGVFASDTSALQELVGAPVLIIESSGRAILIDEISSTDSSDLVHLNCTINHNMPAGSRAYAARALGFSFDADSQILYQHTVDQYGAQRIPFAFGLSRFEIAYEYVSDAGDTRVRPEPEQSQATGMPAVVFTDDDGAEVQLARLRLSLESQSADDGITREYVSYIELSGIGNDGAIRERTISQFLPCGAPVAEDPGGPSDGDGGSGGGGGPGSGGPGSGSDDPGNGGGGPGGPGGPGDDGDDDDDSSGGDDSSDDRNCEKWIRNC